MTGVAGTTQTIPLTTLIGVLDRLEEREIRLLSWGVVDGGFSREEFREAIEDVLFSEGRSHLSVASVSLAMRDRGLVLATVDSLGRHIYRTRTGETIRLAARLRQLFFERDVPDLKWMAAPTLVADYRFLMRARRYPRRYISVADALLEIARSMSNRDDPRVAAAQALLAPRPGDVGELKLARFQVESAARLLRSAGSTRHSGLVVSAGTGSGKTLAFYLPTFAHLASLVAADPGARWTKALALYPRQELLADQFTEALRQARRLDDHLRAVGGRRLLIGAYFGKVPRDASDAFDEKSSWRRRGADRICPYLRCPECDGDLVWKQADAKAGRERLQCTRVGCGRIVGEEEVVLTRNALQRKPADVLFTITESLNRQMSNHWHQHIFGVGQRVRRPHLMLLDEIHTYSGAHGAQVALLLRRWRHAVNKPVQFVGLSATLREAGRFFAQLTGLDERDISVIETPDEEMTIRGREYLLALRGDPVSAKSLLSTSIQTSMLVARILDPLHARLGDQLFGRKLFVFTDDLDVTNRLFDDLCDAEGVVWDGTRARNRPLGSLANIRAASRPFLAPDPPDLEQRRVGGQAWEICEQIGHRLSPDHAQAIGRVSSRDPGVNVNRPVIVATASLEVGYDDNEVGAVLQHKAPHDAARFLQRKGRAGRVPEMRPWTVVVLSDYGRDRLAYQGYDQLFDPELPPRNLAVRNRHVLKMQATMATIDWLSTRLSELLPGNRGQIARDLAGPSAGAYTTSRVRALVDLIRSVLEEPEQARALGTHLRQALLIGERDAEAVLWEPPRALMTAALPTMLRRLESGWTTLREGPGSDRADRDRPLPEFIPASLFSDLNLPEVRVDLPEEDAETENPEMPIAQALMAYAPGRVNRRFAERRAHVSHWIDPGSREEGEHELSIDDICGPGEYDEIGEVSGIHGGQRFDARCVRPRALALQVVDRTIRASSFGRLRWQSELRETGLGEAVDANPPPAWRLMRPRFAVHAAGLGNPLEITRFALGADCQLGARKRR